VISDYREAIAESNTAIIAAGDPQTLPAGHRPPVVTERPTT
jgi:hypothetical protein